MNQAVKISITTAAKAYMQEHGLSQAAFAKLCGLNPSYISNIMNGNYSYKAGEGKEVAINDRYFTTIADLIGLSLKKQYWHTVNTDQFVTIVHALEQAREHGTTKMIIGSTGCGKTYALNLFCRRNPQHVYRITLSNMSSVYDVIDDLTEKIGMSTTIKRQGKVARFTRRVIELAEQGVKPMIVFDECENVKLPVLGMWKALYDQLQGHCALVLLGTPELTQLLQSFCKRGRVGAQQFARRVKAGTIVLPDIDRSFEEFLRDKPIDKGVQTLLFGLCENYGELHDFLEPALRAADEDGVPLTEMFFRKLYRITSRA